MDTVRTLGRLLEEPEPGGRAAPPAAFIPAGELRRIAGDLRERGYVRRGLLGVRLLRNEPLVTEVPEGLPAAGAGVRPGDRILAVDGIPVATTAEVTGFVQRRAPGTEVVLRLRDGDGAEREAAVVLDEVVPPPAARRLFSGFSLGARDSVDLSAAKFPVAAVPGATHLVVTEVDEDCAAARAGLRPGDWIVEIEGKPLLSEDDIKGVLAAYADAESVRVLVYRPGEEQRRTIVLK